MSGWKMFHDGPAYLSCIILWERFYTYLFLLDHLYSLLILFAEFLYALAEGVEKLAA